MVSSPALSTAFTVLFVVTGGWAVVRVAQVPTGRDPRVDPLAEGAHLLMSVAMIAMVWGVVGDAGTPGGLATLAGCGLLAIGSLARLARRVGPRRRGVAAYHLLMAAAMAWSVAAMPALMAPAPAMPHDMGAMGHDMPGMTPTPAHVAAGMAHGPAPVVGGATGASVVVVTWVLLALLVAAAGYWAVRAVRPAVSAGCTTIDVAQPVDPSSTRGAGATAVVTRTATAISTTTTSTTATSAALARLDAGCHVAMSLGMAGMVLAML